MTTAADEASPSRLKLVFCGTPQFAVPTLRRLAQQHDVKLVVTQPDRPKGRGMELALSPVKQAAMELGLPLLQPTAIRKNEEFRAALEAIAPDASIVVGYGRIIPSWMLTLPRLGNINLHASLLPKYRGAAPLQWAIARGERVSGNTTMLLNEGLDTGDILLQEETEISPTEHAISLGARLSASGAELMARTLDLLAAGKLKPTPQDDASATLAPVLEKSDGRIDFQRRATELYDRWRGFQPWPGAFTTFRGTGLKVTGMELPEENSGAQPGEIIAAKHGIDVACGGKTVVRLTELQPEGKKRMTAAAFVNGYKPKPGERFE